MELGEGFLWDIMAYSPHSKMVNSPPPFAGNDSLLPGVVIPEELLSLPGGWHSSLGDLDPHTRVRPSLPL